MVNSRGEDAKRRKVRSDKKRDIKPTISRDLRECIYRLAFITDTPVKDVAEAIVINGITEHKVIEHITQYFQRDMRIDNTLYRRNPDAVPVQRRGIAGQTARITIRFKAEAYEVIRAMSYALDCTVSRACALILDASVRDGDFINAFVERYLREHIDDERMKELRKVLRYVNADNPYGEEYSWANLLSLMVEEMHEAAVKVTDVANDFLIKSWRDK